MTIGEALKSRRLHAGMSQTEMAAGIVSESFYSKVERGVHAIDAETLIKILSVHHFDVTGFFAQINNQSSTGPFFELTSEITFAQNRRDVKALDKIKRKIENGEVQAPLWLKFKLELAYAWALHSNDQISTEMKKKIKKLVLNENWDRTSYHFLSQAVIFLDVDDSKQLVEAAYAAYRKHPATDTFTLQFMAFITINYLNCCYHQHANKSYTESTFNFLQELPVDPAIGLEKLIGKFYQAVFSGDEQKARSLKSIIQDCGYASIIDDVEIDE